MSLIKIFNETLEARKDYVSKKAPHFKIKPSVIGSPCMRKIFYSSGMVPQDFDTDLAGKKRMAIGQAVHDMLQSIFDESGKLIKYRKPDGTFEKDWKTGEDDYEFQLVEPDLYVEKGKIDAVVVIDGQLWLGEFKSINKKGFSELYVPKKDHVIQAVIYWFSFNRALSEGKFSHIPELAGFTKAEGVRFLYVNKDDTDAKEFILTEADSLFAEIVQKIMLAKANHDAQILPPKTKDFCGSCPWRLKCAKNQLK